MSLDQYGNGFAEFEERPPSEAASQIILNGQGPHQAVPGSPLEPPTKAQIRERLACIACARKLGDFNYRIRQGDWVEIASVENTRLLATTLKPFTEDPVFIVHEYRHFDRLAQLVKTIPNNELITLSWSWEWTANVFMFVDKKHYQDNVVGMV